MYIGCLHVYEVIIHTPNKHICSSQIVPFVPVNTARIKTIMPEYLILFGKVIEQNIFRHVI